MTGLERQCGTGGPLIYPGGADPLRPNALAPDTSLAA
jgi:hypothetical protein